MYWWKFLSRDNIGGIDRHVLTKKLNTEVIKLSSKPWITPEISKMNRIRDIKKKNPDNENIKVLYNIFRDRVNR